MIFLDNNATTPILKEVVEAMSFDFDGIPRNPSSITRYGREGRQKIIESRKSIASFFSLSPQEIYFTSGATESNHLLVHGFFARNEGAVITTKLEHPSLQKPIERLGTPIFYLPVGAAGHPSLTDLEAILAKPHPISFVALSAANAETGVLLPIEEFADLCSFYSTPLILDGAAFLGKTPFSSFPQGVSACSFSGHKIHGPKGIGLALIRKGEKIPPLFLGGHQEYGMRAGTENLPAILGLVKAIQLIDPKGIENMSRLRDSLEHQLIASLGVAINGAGLRVSNTSNLYFPHSDGETLLISLDQNGVIASLGSACSSGTLEPSKVLLNMGFSQKRALSSLRFSLSRFTTQAEIDQAAHLIHSLATTHV